VVASPVHGRQTVVLASVSNDATLSLVVLSTAVTGVNAVCVGVRDYFNTTKYV